jgi:hypothetical protein
LTPTPAGLRFCEGQTYPSFRFSVVQLFEYLLLNYRLLIFTIFSATTRISGSQPALDFALQPLYLQNVLLFGSLFSYSYERTPGGQGESGPSEVSGSDIPFYKATLVKSYRCEALRRWPRGIYTFRLNRGPNRNYRGSPPIAMIKVSLCFVPLRWRAHSVRIETRRKQFPLSRCLSQ